MTDSKFKKLVNLYIDKEISAQELAQLKEEIASNVLRRNEFNRFCKVHLAEKKVFLASKSQVNPRRQETCSKHRQSRSNLKLGTESSSESDRSPQQSESASSQNTRIVSATKVRTPKFPTRRKTKVTHLFEYGGMAAGFTLLLLFAGLTLKQSRDNRNQEVKDSQYQDQFTQKSIELYMASKAINQSQEISVNMEGASSGEVVAPVMIVRNAIEPERGFAVFASGGERPFEFESRPAAFIDNSELGVVRGITTLEIDESNRHGYWNEYSEPDYSIVPSKPSNQRGGFSFSRAGLSVE